MPSPLNRVRAQHGLQPLPGPPKPVLRISLEKLNEGDSILRALTQRQEDMVRRFRTLEPSPSPSPPPSP